MKIGQSFCNRFKSHSRLTINPPFWLSRFFCFVFYRFKQYFSGFIRLKVQFMCHKIAYAFWNSGVTKCYSVSGLQFKDGKITQTFIVLNGRIAIPRRNSSTKRNLNQDSQRKSSSSSIANLKECCFEAQGKADQRLAL